MKKSVAGPFLNGALAVSVFFLMFFFAERLLSMLGLPVPDHVNPPNFAEMRKNVEFQYEFRTNSLGLRYKDIPTRKPGRTFRVYVAGDSFVEGQGVAEDEAFCSILERRFSRPGRTVNFINGGLAGTGPQEYGDVFLGIGLKYHPDALLIGLYANDLTNTEPQTRNPLKKWFHRLFPRVSEAWWHLKGRFTRHADFEAGHDMIASVSEEALRRGIDPKRIEEWKSRLPRSLVDAADRGEFTGALLSNGLLNPRYWTDSLDIDTQLAELKWQRMTDLLSWIVGECRRRHIGVALVFVPSAFQYAPEYHRADNPWIVSGTQTRREWLSGDTELERRLKVWAEEKEVPFLDLTPSLRESVAGGHSLIYAMDGHWNAQGHREAAALIGDWLASKGLFLKDWRGQK